MFSAGTLVKPSMARLSRALLFVVLYIFMMFEPSIDPIPIPGLDGYFATTTGVVIGPRGPMTGEIHPRGGHCRLSIRGNHHYVHTLVLTTFVGPRPDNHVCRHLDGNPLNNDISNLAWGTTRENYDDVIKHGVSKRPPTTEDIYVIKFLRELGMFQKSITDCIGISQSTVSKWLINYA